MPGQANRVTYIGFCVRNDCITLFLGSSCTYVTLQRVANARGETPLYPIVYIGRTKKRKKLQMKVLISYVGRGVRLVGEGGGVEEDAQKVTLALYFHLTPKFPGKGNITTTSGFAICLCSRNMESKNMLK